MEETYQDDLRYERAVWPEKFGIQGDTTAIWQERLLLALQGIDISLEKLADKPPVVVNNSEFTEINDVTEITEVKKK